MAEKFGGSPDNQKTILEHPVGLFVLFFTEMWERFSYYGMRALLVLFLTASLLDEGWGWERADALKLYGFYTGLVYLTPIIGGWIADKLLGYRNAVTLGALIMTLGHASMALETPTFFYIGLTCLILGNGLFKPNISSMVGQLYGAKSKKKDSAYTIFYMGINAGAFLGILLCGYIGERVGWSYGFGLAGVFMLFGMLQFWFAQKIFGRIGLSPNALGEFNKNNEAEKEVVVERAPANVERDRMIVIGVLAFFTIFFWMAFEQAGGSMTIFAKDYTSRLLTGGSATTYKIINTILTVGPLAIVTWVLFKLFSQIFSKYALSNLFLGISFAIIWVIGFWLIQNDFKTKSYDIAYNDINNTSKSTSISTTDEFAVGNQLKIVNKRSFDFYNANKGDNKTNTIKNGYLFNKDNEEVSSVVTGVVKGVSEQEVKGLFWKKPTFVDVDIVNSAGIASSIRVPLTIDTTFSVNENVILKVSDDIGYNPKAKGNTAQATVSAVNASSVLVPASWFGILNSFFIIVFAPLFSRIWEARPNISGPVKFAIGLILLGLGFAALAYGSMGIVSGAKTASVSMMWLVLAYLLHTLGELCVSPVGLSYVSKLAPVRFVGLMFGIWFISNFIANTLAGLSGSYIDKISESYSLSTFFLLFTIVPIVAGLILLVLNPMLKRMMHGIK